METVFVKILNSALLVFALLCLVITGLAFAFVLAMAPSAFFSDTADRPVTVVYHSAAAASSEQKDEGAAPAADNEDPKIAAAAKASCDASNALYEFMTDKRYSLADRDNCPKTEAEQTKQNYGDRALNYLEQRVSYIKAVIAEGRPHQRFPMPDDDSAGDKSGQYFNDIDGKFQAEFAAAAARDEARKARAQASSLEGRAAEVAFGTVSAMAFFTFLVTGFLLMAARIERHVGAIADKTAGMPR